MGVVLMKEDESLGEPARFATTMAEVSSVRLPPGLECRLL